MAEIHPSDTIPLLYHALFTNAGKKHRDRCGPGNSRPLVTQRIFVLKKNVANCRNLAIEVPNQA